MKLTNQIQVDSLRPKFLPILKQWSVLFFKNIEHSLTRIIASTDPPESKTRQCLSVLGLYTENLKSLLDNDALKEVAYDLSNMFRDSLKLFLSDLVRPVGACSKITFFYQMTRQEIENETKRHETLSRMDKLS